MVNIHSQDSTYLLLPTHILPFTHITLYYPLIFYHYILPFIHSKTISHSQKHFFILLSLQNDEKFAYYFSISRISEQELASRNASSERVHLYSATLSVSDRMLHYLIAYILLPKHSNHSQISDVDMKLIFAIKNRIKVNLAYVIMHYTRHQRNLRGSLPYGHIISLILDYCNVPLNREPCVEMTKRACEISVKAANKKMDIFKDKDGLYKHIEQPIPPPNVAPTPIPTPVPEGGFSNEFLYSHIRGMEERINLNINTRFDNLRTEFLTALANQNQDESEEEMDEDQA